MRLILGLLIAVILLAQKAPDAPKAPEPTLKEQYWHAIAAYYQQNGLFQRSLSDQQKKLQEAVAKIESEIGDLRVKMKADCAARKPPQELDESGTNADCKPLPAVKTPGGQ